jgi:bacteriochlorophyllide a dehydrogenase
MQGLCKPHPLHQMVDRALCVCHQPPGKVALRPFAFPAPGPGELLIENRYSAVSPGTELRGLRGQQAGMGAGPYVPGYQAVGRIVAVGPEVERAVGEWVFHYGGKVFGDGLRGMWGGHASHALIDAAGAFAIEPEAGPPLSLGKLGGIAWHGLDVGQVRAGEHVGVIGLGILGQLSARLASRRGASVVAFDRLPSRVAAATAFGLEGRVVEQSLAAAARQSGWPERGFDVLIDATGAPALLDEVIALARDLTPWEAPARPPTRIVLQGSYADRASFDYQAAFLKELNLFLPRDNTRASVEAVLPLLASGELAVEELIGALVAPARAPEIYAELASPRSQRLTAVFDWTLV